ncbi:hypothetical protein NW762_012893 [Fusarium torreyae]|uniref:Uncharacterized protein n=1 Tax=Fusarium torreyae TaxID=1237075 RepID=A0A9W8VB05_9HYPO|nr:hypothetical protein NW762_012893 [Fusarium torreyae]
MAKEAIAGIAYAAYETVITNSAISNPAEIGASSAKNITIGIGPLTGTISNSQG